MSVTTQPTYYKVRPGFAVLFPETIDMEDRVWAKGGEVIEVTDHILEGWAKDQFHKLDEVEDPNSGTRLIKTEYINPSANALWRQLTRTTPAPKALPIEPEESFSAPDVDAVEEPPTKPPTKPKRRRGRPRKKQPEAETVAESKTETTLPDGDDDLPDFEV